MPMILKVLRYGCLISLSLGAIACGGQLQFNRGADTSPSPTVTAQVDPILPRLLGEWRVEGQPSEGGQQPSIFFSQQGKGYFINELEGKKQAIAFEYRLQSNQKPMQINLLLPGEAQPIETIFELGNDGSLRLETQTQPGAPRPTNFSTQVVKLKRVYTQPTLPKDVIIIDTSQISSGSNLAQESEGRTHVSAISRAQQAHYLEQAKFAANLADLKLGIPAETASYRYQIIARKHQQVIVTAQAKSDKLKSFTGVVLAEKTENAPAESTFAFICETEAPSQTPPPIGEIVRVVEFQCPAGSRRVR